MRPTFWKSPKLTRAWTKSVVFLTKLINLEAKSLLWHYSILTHNWHQCNTTDPSFLQKSWIVTDMTLFHGCWIDLSSAIREKNARWCNLRFLQAVFYICCDISSLISCPCHFCFLLNHCSTFWRAIIYNNWKRLLDILLCSQIVISW